MSSYRNFRFFIQRYIWVSLNNRKVSFLVKCIFSLKSVSRLVHWFPLLTLIPKSHGFKPQTGQKRRTKIQSSIRRSEIRITFFMDLIRNQKSKIRTRVFRVILRDQNVGLYKIPTYETSLEVLAERKPEKFSKFRANINCFVGTVIWNLFELWPSLKSDNFRQISNLWKVCSFENQFRHCCCWLDCHGLEIRLWQSNFLDRMSHFF
jgi:hypothetical protein